MRAPPPRPRHHPWHCRHAYRAPPLRQPAAPGAARPASPAEPCTQGAAPAPQGPLPPHCWAPEDALPPPMPEPWAAAPLTAQTTHPSRATHAPADRWAAVPPGQRCPGCAVEPCAASSKPWPAAPVAAPRLRCLMPTSGPLPAPTRALLATAATWRGSSRGCRRGAIPPDWHRGLPEAPSPGPPGKPGEGAAGPAQDACPVPHPRQILRVRERAGWHVARSTVAPGWPDPLPQRRPLWPPPLPGGLLV
mmetsp:Transcript_36377/g.91896  ORF Transcript_36377/g.91896 Transcript_36377/m.91896 type:complete len:248 (+) Transcript_36377:2391-3134(+)